LGIANYTNMSELMNEMLKAGREVSISDLVKESLRKTLILASEGTPADTFDLENGFISLVDALYRAGAIRPAPADDAETHMVQLYESGELAENGYGGDEGDRFLEVKWIALTDNLPVIVNLNL
jgi:hypothetical protein